MNLDLRKKVAKVVMALMFSLLILSFAVWGIGDIFRGGRQIEAVAEVGDSAIGQQDFSRQLSREVTRLSGRLNSQLDADQIRALGVPVQVLQRMITGALMDQQTADMGMVVGDQQIRERIAEEPAFQNEAGGFDPARFDQVLRLSGLSEGMYVDELRKDIGRRQLGRAATGGVAVSRRFLEAFYTYREERRIADTILVPSGDGADLPEPSQEQLEEIHETFAGNFESPEFRSVTLVELSPDDLMDEIAVGEDEVEAEFEARRHEFSKPERRSIEQVLFESASEARVFKSTLDGGQDFTAAADGLSGVAPVVLADLSHEDLAVQLPELADAVFALSQGDAGGPVESPFGWHVFRVTAVVPAHEPSLADMADTLKAEIARRYAIDSLVSIANQLDDEIAGGATLEEAARRLGLEVRTLSAVDRSGRDQAGTPIELPAADQILSDMFAAAEGEASLLSETPDGRYYMFRVDGVDPAAVRPLAEVRAAVADLWRAQEAGVQARVRADLLAERVRSGEDMAALAEAEGLTFATTPPIDRFGAEPGAVAMPALTTRLFDLATGDVVVAEAPDGWVVARLEDIRPGDPAAAPEAIDALEATLVQSLQNDLLSAFAGELERTYGVSINAAAVDNVVSAY